MGELRKLAKAETQAEESGEHVPMVGVSRSDSARARETRTRRAIREIPR